MSFVFAREMVLKWIVKMGKFCLFTFELRLFNGIPELLLDSVCFNCAFKLIAKLKPVLPLEIHVHSDKICERTRP